MATNVREIEIVRTTHLGAYRDIDRLDALVDHLHREGREVSNLLGPHHVWMLNSTASGGGVAEMLPRKCSLLAEVGVDVRWIVLEPDDPHFFRLTKCLHNMLHGVAGSADIGAGRKLYERVNCEAAKRLRFVDPQDVLVVHDPQPLGVAEHMRPELRPRLMWRCHVGVPEGNEYSDAAWDFLMPYVVPYERTIFSAAPYVPDELLSRSAIIAPGIDPLSHKNRELRPYKLNGVLRAAGLVDGPPVPKWARFQAPVLRWSEGEWVSRPIPNFLHVPLVLQVSRFDRLKGFQHLIPAFDELLSSYCDRARHIRADLDRVESELGAVQLVLAGPDPEGVADDPEAGELLEELCAQVDALPEDIRHRVHILRLPMVNAKENALIVNALQRVAMVVVQNSVREGFGLTVAEALWKGTPVVAANVGGLALQVRHGSDGLLVYDPTNHAEIAVSLLQALTMAKEVEAMARTGRTRVREHFLVLTQLSAWLRELKGLLSQKRPPHAGA